MPDQIYSVKWNDVTKKAWSYDGLGRIKSESVYPSVGHSLQSTYTYKDATGNTTTTLVSDVQSSLGDYSYQYDANGNITRIDYNNLRVCTSALTQYQVNYEYDEFNQLVRCYGDNISYGGTYTYDDNGNITSKNNNTYGYTNSVWGDLLTSYNGNTITYDTIGNPLTYKNGETFMWQNGRRLNMILDGNDITAVYYYDVSGSRISKSTQVGDTFFTYAGDILAAQKTGNNILVWIYDNDGKYIGFTYNGVEYYYVYNLQGDVEAIADSTGTIVARYTYDPWGKNISITDGNGTDVSSNATHIANINPIRYRGYYYDTETGFYYVSSRYYDPEIGRFINADGAVSGVGGVVQGYNMFAYCMNNPVNKLDGTGAWPKWIKNAASAVTKAAKKVVSVVTKIANSIKSSFSPASHVSKTHVTTPMAMIDLGILFGKVGFSSTVTKQNKEPGLVHSASDIGNDAIKYSAGINIVGWLGADVGVSSEINAFVSVQVTPWVHGEVSRGLDGMGNVIGFDVGDTSYDFEINSGWGLIAIFFAPQIVLFGGQPSGAPA